MSFYWKDNGQKIEIDASPIASGGEGGVFNIKSTPSLCAKIYNNLILTDKVKLKSYKEKIEYMVKNPISSPHTQIRICVAKNLLYSDRMKRNFVGFTMEKAFANSISLFDISKNYKLETDIKNLGYERFDNSEGNRAIYNRIAVSINIAQSIRAIHNAGNYVLGDCKPQNILITKEGYISIVDMDSMQIQNNYKTLSAPVGTIEYTPPEAYRNGFNRNNLQQSWDYFSYAVMAYELIIGSHPFKGFYTSHPNNTTLGDNIKCGLFISGSNNVSLQKNRGKYPAHISRTLTNWNTRLNIDVRRCFINAFDDGFQNPNKRPTMDMWIKVLLNLLKIYGSQPISQMNSHPQPQIRFCRKCGAKRASSLISFCSQCGYKF